MCGISVGVVADSNTNNRGFSDKFTALGSVEREGNKFTFSTGFEWTINGNSYANIIPISIQIDPAADGYYRTDIAYVDTNNDIKHLVGIPSDKNTNPIILPVNCLLLATWQIYGNTISSAVLVDLGNQYVRKSFSNEIIVYGQPNYLKANTTNGEMSFVFANNNIGPFDFFGFTQFQNNPNLYDGKLFTLKNAGQYEIVLKNQQGDNNIIFNFAENANYFLKPGEIIVLRYSKSRGLEKLGANLPAKYIEVYGWDELNSLVQNNQLIPGIFYKVYDVNPDLYGGINVYIQALTTNSLSKDGTGRFFNPRYDKNSDFFGIWTDLVIMDMNIQSGKFTPNEPLVSNNGAEGVYLANGTIRYISGDWLTSTLMTGQTSGAVAEIFPSLQPEYSIGQKIIYGGLVWTNITGNIGHAIDTFSLTGDWESIEYNDFDYQEVFDKIVYDWNQNLILERHEAESGNSVIVNVPLYQHMEINPIKVFQWGNSYTKDIVSQDATGIGVNFVNGGFCNNLNFIGKSFTNNKFEPESILQNPVYSASCQIDFNNFSKGQNLNNVVFGVQAIFQKNDFGGSDCGNFIIGAGASLKNCSIASEAFINGFEIINECEINGLELKKGAYLSNFFLKTGVSLSNISFGNGSSLSDIGDLQQNIRNLEIDSDCNIEIDLTGATLIYNAINKRITKTENGQLKILYIDSANTLAVADVDA